ncbi:MAG TPA: insulinase family protein [Candidatus Hydrogenedentes bacterium]|nr:insulinase family protein [Candidatus Hydrogenedentota bacterium]HIJ72869.1 insulinase family protein [Candidatus Hydrogenedentota bacterium]
MLEGNDDMNHWRILLAFGTLSVLATFSAAGGPGLVPYPEFVDVTLDNGLRVLVAEHQEQPAVFYRMLVPVGVRDEPCGKEGLASLAAALLTQGTVSRSDAEIAEAIDGVGGRLRATAGIEYTTVGSEVLAEDLELGLELFSESILSPTFPAKAFKRARKEFKAAVEQRHTDPSALAITHACSMLIDREHRLSRPVTKKSLRHVQVAAVRAFHRRHYVPNGSMLVALGDFGAQEMLERITETFGGWEPGAMPARAPVSLARPAGVAFRFVHKPGLTQGTIALCQPGLSSSDPDVPAWRLLNRILGGGGFSSRLMTAIRTEAGRTYSISSHGIQYPDYGYSLIRTSTQNREVVATYEAVLAEIDKLLDEGVTEEELEKAKSYYAGSIPLGLEWPGHIATSVLEGLYEGRTLGDMRNEIVELDAVTLEDVNRVARKYLNTEAFILVIVGDGRRLRKPLRAIAPFEEVHYGNASIR